MDLLIFQISRVNADNVNIDDLYTYLDPHGEITKIGSHYTFHKEIEVPVSRGQPVRLIENLLDDLSEMKDYLKSISNLDADLVLIWLPDASSRKSYILSLKPKLLGRLAEYGIGLNCPYWQHQSHNNPMNPTR